MLTRPQLRSIAFARLRDARALIGSGRFDGAEYLAGYAVGVALKARIVRTLRWSGFPETKKEFENLGTLEVHDFAVLLRFTGREAAVSPSPEWLVVLAWSPERRYKPVGTASPATAGLMLSSATAIVRRL